MNRIPSEKLNLKFTGAHGNSADKLHCYRLAGKRLQADCEVGLLDNFRIDCPEKQRSNVQQAIEDGHAQAAEELSSSVSDSEWNASETRVTGWLAESQREVVNRFTPHGYSLNIAGIGRFEINRSSSEIRCLELKKELPRVFAEEAILGPPMAIALALRDTWCLHASAFSHNGSASLILGPSGHGKSTLAGFMGLQGGESISRVADDISPCRLGSDGCELLPHFPQPKIADAQYPLDGPERLPLKNIFVLERQAATAEAKIEPMTPIEAIRQITNQTVAVSLFDRPLHRQHLKFLAALVQSTHIFRLHYPHDRDKLPRVSDLLSRQL